MKIAIIGAGHVGGALGRGLEQAGHEVVYGRRGAVREAVVAADAVILATPWTAAQEALAAAGDLGGKPLLDATNPIGAGFALTHGHTDSGGEQVARWATNARVVKVFNTTGYENMADPRYGEARATMFLAGDDAAACDVAAALARDLGFDAIPVGKLDQARLLEPLAMLWIRLALVLGHGRNIALVLARR